MYLLRNEGKEKICEDTIEGSPEETDKTKSEESSSETEEPLKEKNSSPDIAETSNEVTERVVPLAPQEEDVDDDIINSDSKSR